MNILLLTGIDLDNIGGVQYHRLYTPFNNIGLEKDITVAAFPTLRFGTGEVNLNGQEFKIPMDGTLPHKKWLEQFDVCVFSRNISPVLRPHQEFTRLHEAGVKIVIDIDDYWEVDKDHVLYNYQQQSNLSKCIADQIRVADMVWCTHKKLAEYITHELGRKRNIVTVQNAIDPNEPQFAKESEYNYDRVFYQGSVTHFHDLKLIAPAVNQLGANMKITGFGKDVVWDRVAKLFNNLEKQDALPVFRYGAAYDGEGVCVVPLRDTKFTRGKSELKMIEAGWFKKSVAVSNVYPYTRLIKDGKNCLAVDDDWKGALKRLLDNPSLQDDLREQLHEDVKQNYMIADVNKKRIQALKSLC